MNFMKESITKKQLIDKISIVSVTRMVSNDSGEKLCRSRFENKNCLSYGQTVEYETLWISVRHRQGCVEEMEKTLLRTGSSVAVHVRNVQLQGEKV